MLHWPWLKVGTGDVSLKRWILIILPFIPHVKLSGGVIPGLSLALAVIYAVRLNICEAMLSVVSKQVV